MYFQDTFNYQILPGVIPHPGSVPFSSYRVLPTVFLSNDGDNIGVIHNDTNMDSGPDNYVDLPGFLQTSPNFNFTSVRPVRPVKIKGHIDVQPVDGNAGFGFSFFTNLSQVLPGFTSTHAGSGVLYPGSRGIFRVMFRQDNYTTVLLSPQTIYFEKIIYLAAGENLFLMPFSSSGPNFLVQILGGSYTMEFASNAADTAPSGVLPGTTCSGLLVKNILSGCFHSVSEFQFRSRQPVASAKSKPRLHFRRRYPRFRRSKLSEVL